MQRIEEGWVPALMVVRQKRVGGPEYTRASLLLSHAIDPWKRRADDAFHIAAAGSNKATLLIHWAEANVSKSLK